MSNRDTIGEFLFLLESANGREKLARLLQFSAKYFKWKEEIEKQRNERLVQVWGNVQTSMSNVRKFLRLFRSLAILRSFQQSLPGSFSELTAPLFFNLSAKVFLSTYFLFDHAIYAERLGIWNPDPETLKQVNQATEGSWLGEILCSICEQLAVIASLHSNRDDLSSVMTASTASSTTTVIISPASQTAVRAAYSVALRSLLRNLLDLPIALHFLDVEWVRSVPHGHFGLLGVLSTSLSLYEMWPVIVLKD